HLRHLRNLRFKSAAFGTTFLLCRASSFAGPSEDESEDTIGRLRHDIVRGRQPRLHGRASKLVRIRAKGSPPAPAFHLGS
ncbi:MAG: hypothetical protein ACKOTF_18290, partial [Opitutaceae bacterium]